MVPSTVSVSQKAGARLLCPVCGQSRDARKDARYCSDACRRKASRQRERARTVAQIDQIHDYLRGLVAHVNQVAEQVERLKRDVASGEADEVQE